MICHGNAEDHCCWFQGRVCEFLEENTVPGRRWACGLFRELGSWDAVHADPRYEPVKVRMSTLSFAPALCGDWPPPGKVCNTCGGCG